MPRDVSKWPVEERLKYFGARWAYAHRWELTPTPLEDGTRITWATWFYKRFGVSLDDYQRQLAENDHAPEQTTGEGGQSDFLSR
jgi:hypothetical protein